MNSIPKPPVLRAMLSLFLASIVIAAALYFHSKVWAWSVLAGALIYIIPHSYFSAYAFRFRGARASRLIAQSFYRGEVGKYLLTLIGFACAFASPLPLAAALIFISYGISWLLGSYLLARVVNE
ncbi:MAG: ATP synthase subunit I [Cellvibrionaceae bacterium]|nr:ATP synthase subunit I [Cellvibrionaceae bacterium]